MCLSSSELGYLDEAVLRAELSKTRRRKETSEKLRRPIPRARPTVRSSEGAPRLQGRSQRHSGADSRRRTPGSVETVAWLLGSTAGRPPSGVAVAPKPSHRANRLWRWPAYHVCLARSRVRLALVPSITPPLSRRPRPLRSLGANLCRKLLPGLERFRWDGLEQRHGHRPIARRVPRGPATRPSSE